MKHLEGRQAMREASRRWLREGRRVGLVPTMGALHPGHISLVEASVKHCEQTVVSLFVNPLQFNDPSDLERYPRDLDGDRRRLEEAGADVLFTTSPADMYPPDFQTQVLPGDLAGPLCGATRPGHFGGVTTVVTKLFHLVAPQLAWFGQKDFQQARILQRMVRDLDFDLTLRILPTVREEDGLALSSRNLHLSAADRQQAPVLHQALQQIRASFQQGERRCQVLAQEGQRLLDGTPGLRLDYLQVLDDESLESRETLGDGGVAACAAWLGSTRLIDNLLLGTAEERLG